MSRLLEKREAITLRRQGFSINEIQAKLKVSKGSVSVWVRDVPLTAFAKLRIYRRKRRGVERSIQSKRFQTELKLEEAAVFARKVVSRIRIDKNHARLYSALLYWCEGEKSKNDKSLIFTNSDPTLVASFLRNLRQGFDVDESKFRICMHLHSYHDPGRQITFWSNVTKIPTSQFIAPYQKKNSGRNRKVGYAGCASVRYHDVKTARKVHAVARAFLN